MKQAGVAEVKARLSYFLACIRAGQEVTITDRGLPVARIVRLDGSRGRAGRRRRLVEAGVLLAGRGRVRRSLLRPPRRPAEGADVLGALLDERAHGR
jgi:prevent-host-death family protein